AGISRKLILRGRAYSHQDNIGVQCLARKRDDRADPPALSLKSHDALREEYVDTSVEMFGQQPFRKRNRHRTRKQAIGPLDDSHQMAKLSQACSRFEADETSAHDNHPTLIG